MNIWLVKTGEPVPVDSTERLGLHRTGLMAKIFAAAGHEVTWFTSTFDRVERRNLFDEDQTIIPFPGVKIILIHSPGYKRSLSLGRVRDQRIVSKKFVRAMQAEARPDVIVCSFPTIELSKASVDFGNENGVPVVVDVRDMWPDIIVDSAPVMVRPFVKLMLRSMARDARAACAEATAITGITAPFVQWGLDRGNRLRTVLDRDFPLAQLRVCPSLDHLDEAGRFWDSLGIMADSKDFGVVFLGTLGHQFDVETILKAARTRELKSSRFRFIICGDGDKLERYRRLVTGCHNVVFPGWIDLAQAHVLMRRCKVGIDPLPDRYDFLATINNKAIEYMSAGLPVVSSPENGILCDLLRKHACGMSYAEGDVNGLALILLRLASDPQMLADLSANAVALFEQRFQAENVYTDFCAHLQHVVQTARRISQGAA